MHFRHSPPDNFTGFLTFNENIKPRSESSERLLVEDMIERIRYEYLFINVLCREIDDLRQNLNEQSNSFRAKGLIFEAIENFTKIKKY
jgi:hypothetical protein